MKVSLGEQDALAVDLLLDRSSVASRGDGNGGSPVFVSAADGVSRDRVRGAEKVLGLLNWMPVEDPSHDLVARTLGRLEQVGRHDQPVVMDPVVHSPRPHA